jgi:hypothetical protein
METQPWIDSLAGKSIEHFSAIKVTCLLSVEPIPMILVDQGWGSHGPCMCLYEKEEVLIVRVLSRT